MESYGDGIYSDLAETHVSRLLQCNRCYLRCHYSVHTTSSTGHHSRPLRSYNSSPADVFDETRVVVVTDGGVSKIRRRGDSNP